MQDVMDFFSKEYCDRCGRRLIVRMMSMFNTDTICPSCRKKEETHPDFERARDAGQDAIRSGKQDFRGIGLPSDLR